MNTNGFNIIISLLLSFIFTVSLQYLCKVYGKEIRNSNDVITLDCLGRVWFVFHKFYKMDTLYRLMAEQ